jgi:enoyl-CoA hydratase
MPVTYALEEQVAVITFDDGKANAYTHEALRSLSEALDRAHAEEARAVLLAGRPGRFSAGFDLATMTAGPGPMRELVAAGARFLARLFLEPRPVVAACTGHALAAGALVLLAADHRIGAAGGFKIGLNEVAIGLAMPVFGVELARYRMPPSALDHVILGETGGPEEACAAGFLDRVVAPEDLLAAAFSAAAGFAALQPAAVAGTKTRARGAVARRMLEDLEADLSGLTLPAPAGS